MKILEINDAQHIYEVKALVEIRGQKAEVTVQKVVNPYMSELLHQIEPQIELSSEELKALIDAILEMAQKEFPFFGY